MTTCLHILAYHEGLQNDHRASQTSGDLLKRPTPGSPLIYSVHQGFSELSIVQVGQVALRSYQDDSFAIEVDIGTPIQTLHLGVDLYGSDVTVAGAACVQCCHKDATYDPTKSMSNSKSCSVPVDKGDGTSQATCHDILSAIDFRSPDFVFSEVTTATHTSAFVQNVWDGTFGLTQAGLVEQPFGFFMKRTCANGTVGNAGTLTHGGIDEQNCNALTTGSKPSANVCTNFGRLENGLWGVEMSAVKLDSNQITYGGPFRASFTTTSAYVLVPKKAFDQLVALELWETLANSDGDWDISCEAKGQFFFSLGTQNFQMDLKQLMYTREDKICFLRMRPRADNDPHANYWTFGLPLFRSYCALFDLKSNTVALAPPKVTPTTQCVYEWILPKDACAEPKTTASTATPPTDPPANDRTTKAAARWFPAYADVTILSVLVVLIQR